MAKKLRNDFWHRLLKNLSSGERKFDMRYAIFILTIINIVLPILSYAQTELQLLLPDQDNWNTVNEGETLQFTLKATGGSDQNYSFQYKSEEAKSLKLTNGVVTWTPAYDVVIQGEESRIIPVAFRVTTTAGEQATQTVDFIVQNTIRIPILEELQPFFIQPSVENTFSLSLDPQKFALEADTSQFVDGMIIQPMDDKHWQLRWKPSREQFAALRQEPAKVKLLIRDKELGDGAAVEISLLPASATAREETLPSQANLELLLPRTSYWNVVNEGKVLSFKLAAQGGTDDAYNYRVLNAQELGLSYDKSGNVYWRPSFDLVDRLSDTKAFPVTFEVENQSGETSRKSVKLLVNHVNRPPEIGEMRNFYVSYGKENTYSLGATKAVIDPDEDPVVFKPILTKMPQGMSLSAGGVLKWIPSVSQYNRLKREPLMLPFIVEDQPYEAQTQGTLRIEVTQQDLPPEISMIPDQNYHQIKEDQELNIKFYLSDPNGDEDIVSFDFVTDSHDIPRSALVSNEPTQWEFVWQPGYDLLSEPGDTSTYRITFFAIDRSNQREERTIQVHVQDAENLAEKDQLLYNQYRTGLVRAMNLMDQLKDRQKVLQKDYKKARKGKKHRAITTASLGAVTGLSPVVLSGNDAQPFVSGIGGTTSMTIGSLEASNVIGKDASDIYENLSYINQKLLELQTQGNLFAGKYALSINRRMGGFSEDLRKLVLLLSLDKVTKLELDPSWKNPRKASDKNIKNTFSDYNPDPDRSPYINE